MAAASRPVRSGSLGALSLLALGSMAVAAGAQMASQCVADDPPCSRIEQSILVVVLIGGTSLFAVGIFWLILSLANRR